MRSVLNKLIFIWIGMAAGAPGAITYSGVQNLTIPVSFGGVYLDFDNPTNAASFVVDPVGVSTGSTVPVPWDLNFFFGGAGIANSDTAAPHTSGTGSLSPVVNLAPGTVLSTGDTFPSGFSGSLGHMGSAPGQFTSSAGGGPGGTEGYIGFRIDPSSFTSGAPPAAPMVGWLRVTLEDDGSVGVIHDWAWETEESSIEIGAIPEPGVWSLALVALVALAGRRNRRA